MAANQEVLKALAAVRKGLDTKYKASTELFPDFTSIKQIEVIPSPSAIINAVTGVGGFPRGRLTEIYGPFSSGKTTIATETAVGALTASPENRVLYLDYEHAFDAVYARKLGLDLDPSRFIFAQPEYAEQGMEIVDRFIEAGLVDMIVIDSAAAMTPKSEMEGELDQDGGTQKGEQARLMAKFLAIETKKMNKGRKPAMVMLNQTRAVINIGPGSRKNAPKEQSAAGSAIKFYASIRLSLDILNNEGAEGRNDKAGVDQTYTQNIVRVEGVKNKLAPPFMRGKLIFEYGKGLNNLASIAVLAEAELKLMSGAGFYKYVGLTPETSFTCRGRDAFLELLEKDPGKRAEIEARTLQSLKDKQAELLGISEIKVSGKAKVVEGDTLYLESRNTPSNPSNQSQDPSASPSELGQGLPVVDDDQGDVE